MARPLAPRALERREAAPAPSLHDRKVRLMRTRLADLALEPLLERGWGAVTIDDLAAAAGISRRTFFRYFATKEDVVISAFDEAGHALLAEIARRAETQPPLDALRGSLQAIIGAFGTNPTRARATLRMIRRTPSLRGQFLVKQDDWTEQLAALIRARMPRSAHAPMLAQLHARVAIAAIDTALAAWGEREGGDLAAIAGEAFDALRVVVAPAPAPRRKR